MDLPHSLLSQEVCKGEAMFTLPPPASPQSWPLQAASSRFFDYPRSPVVSLSRFGGLLTKFPLPPQGRNVQNQIGLFPAIYTIPFQQPPPSAAETQPLSPQSPVNVPKGSFSSSSDGVYDGVNLHSDPAFAGDNPLNAETVLSDVEEAIGEFTIASSASSQLSSPAHERSEIFGENCSSDEEETLVSSTQVNPILAQIRKWSPQDVAAFLVDRGFPNQAPNFVRHEISGAILLELDLAMLKEVDIAAFGVRFGIMREIEGLRKLAMLTKPTAHQRTGSKDQEVRAPQRSPARSGQSGDDDLDSLDRLPGASRSSKHSSPVQFSTLPRDYYRRNSYEPSSPHSATSSRPYSFSHDKNRIYTRRSSGAGHRSTQSQDSGFGESYPDLDQTTTKPGGHARSRSTASGIDGSSSMGRVRIDSQDSGLGHSRHTSTDTTTKSPGTAGHKRQNSSLATLRAQPPSIPLMEAVGARWKNELARDTSNSSNASGSKGSSTVILPGTRSEAPQSKPTAKFLIAPNSTRSPVPDKPGHPSNENGVRLVKSYGQLRRRSSSTTSPPVVDGYGDADSHQHRSTLLRNISAKEASAQADYSGWLKKRTERGASIAGLSVGPGAGMVGGWKKRWFVLQGRRLSYYHSDKVFIPFLVRSNLQDAKEKGVIDITAHRCVTTVSASSPPSTSPTEVPNSTGPTRKISLTGGSKLIFKLVPPAPGASRAVTFTPQKTHIFSAENEIEFRGWVESLMKANIGLDATGAFPCRFTLIVAPVISSSTVPLISLSRAKEMRSRPPALDLSEANRPSPVNRTAKSSYVTASNGETLKSTKGQFEPKSPPLPTPPLAKTDEVKGNFELEMEKALGKVGKAEGKTPESEKKQPILELSIPIGLS